MSETLLVILTVAEIIVLIAALAIFGVVLARQLRSIGVGLETASANLGGLDGDPDAVPSAVGRLNRRLEHLATSAADLAEKAEKRSARRPE